MPIPLMILSDAPTAGTGLGRIAGDVALRIARNMPDVFRVATLGYAGIASRHLPYQQYILEDIQDFVCPTLTKNWQDWAGDEQGILLTIWDLSRIGWLTRPEMLCEIPPLKEFLQTKPFKLWSYLPIDASGPHDRLTYPLKESLKGIDRVLTYGKWAAGIVDRTMDYAVPTTPYLPHGIDGSIFYERHRSLCRKMFISITQAINLFGALGDRITKDEILIGIVATNQGRKDYSLGIKAVAQLAEKYKVRLWIKTNALENAWSIPALIIDHGLRDNAVISLGDMTDDQMAQAYSACDLTLGIGLGEGYGYPIHESLFCGTPCIHGDYGGAPEWMTGQIRQEEEPLLVKPTNYRNEGPWTCVRPIFSPSDWAAKAEAVLGRRTNHNGELEWNTLWPSWEKWLKDGIE